MARNCKIVQVKLLAVMVAPDSNGQIVLFLPGANGLVPGLWSSCTWEATVAVLTGFGVVIARNFGGEGWSLTQHWQES